MKIPHARGIQPNAILSPQEKQNCKTSHQSKIGIELKKDMVMKERGIILSRQIKNCDDYYAMTLTTS